MGRPSRTPPPSLEPVSRSPRPRRALLLLGTAAVAAGALPLAALGDPPALAPTLRADPPERILQPREFREGVNGGEPRLLVKFDGFVTNVGQGALEVSGNPQIEDPGHPDAVHQRAETAPGSGPMWREGARRPHKIVGTPEVIFEDGDGHNHFHLQHAMRYSLWTTDRAAQAAPGQKVGFCLYDIEHAPQPRPAPGPAVYSDAETRFCETTNNGRTPGPRSSRLVMGVSPGWRDVYHRELAFQWVDVSDTAPGRYVLAAEADPDDRVWEGDQAGPKPRAYADDQIVVPGHLAQPRTVAQDPGGVDVTLAAERFGSPGPVRYRIVEGPRHGSLSVPVGVGISDPRVRYTPEPGYRGSDAFRYVAFDPSSPYPRNPPAAAVTVAGESVGVSISGAPAALFAGTDARLSAEVANAPGGVRWSVNGAPGGDGEVGTITADGHYRAPERVPPEGRVTIRATSERVPESFAEAVVGIRAVPEARPAPGIASARCAVVPRRPSSPGGGRVALTAEQLLINQRIAQAALRRANAVEAWLRAGIATRDLCGGGVGLAALSPSIPTTPVDEIHELTPPNPRPLRPAGRSAGRADAVGLSARQLLINQRVSQAAIRRLNALERRLDGGLTGGDLREGAVTRGKIRAGVGIRGGGAGTQVGGRPAASRTRVAPPARGGPGRVALSAEQLRINQRIAQAAVRRANALQDRLRAGLTEANFRPGSIVAANLAPEIRP